MWGTALKKWIKQSEFYVTENDLQTVGHNDTLMSDRQLTSWTKCYCVRGVCWVFTWIVSFVFNTKLAFLPRSPTMCWVQEMTWNTVWVLSVLQLHTLWSWFGFLLSQHLQSLICTLASTDTLLCNISFYIIDSPGTKECNATVIACQTVFSVLFFQIQFCFTGLTIVTQYCQRCFTV